MIFHPDFHDPWLVNHSVFLLECYEHWLGKSFFPKKSDRVAFTRELFLAPFALLSSGCEKDPMLNYGNLTTLQLWETSWEEFCKTPGRETAEKIEQESRERFLREVEAKGSIQNYEGIRISKTGRRFRIQDACVWNLIDSRGNYYGQAAVIRKWVIL